MLFRSTVKSGSATLGTTTVGAAGTWSYALSAANIATLGQGSGKAVSVTVTDAAGNVSSAVSTSFNVDTVAPGAPSITAVGGTDATVSSQGGDGNVVGQTEAGEYHVQTMIERVAVPALVLGHRLFRFLHPLF